MDEVNAVSGGFEIWDLRFVIYKLSLGVWLGFTRFSGQLLSWVVMPPRGISVRS